MSTNSPNQEDFPINPSLGKGLLLFFYSQLFVTGANSGLGLEAAQHFYRLNAARLILAVRTIAKGQEAKEYILQTNPQRCEPNSIEIWCLDLASTESTLAFADRVKADLPRLDVLINNAGINSPEWKLHEGFEQAVQINVLNTFLLATSLLPKLEATSATLAENESTPHLVVVSSEAHRLTKFPEINAPDLYVKLNNRNNFSQQPRYQVTKLMEVLFTRELVARLDSSTSVIINIVNPGLCSSNLERNSGKSSAAVQLIRCILDRTTEVGSRTLVLGASAPASSHGEFQSDGVNQDVEAWIYTEVGKQAQKKVFEQTMQILEARKLELAQEAGLRDL